MVYQMFLGSSWLGLAQWGTVSIVLAAHRSGWELSAGLENGANEPWVTSLIQV